MWDIEIRYLRVLIMIVFNISWLESCYGNYIFLFNCSSEKKKNKSYYNNRSINEDLKYSCFLIIIEGKWYGEIDRNRRDLTLLANEINYSDSVILYIIF